METAFGKGFRALHFYTLKHESAAMAKLEIDFILIDDTVVMNGFRAMMSGAKLEAFKKNPVMLFMHNRAEARFETAENDIMLPVGKWYDIRVVDNQVLAKPDFDDDDDFAKKIEGKVKKGYLNAASIWIDPIAVSDDDALALAGQRGPTITEWGILEASIVDIPNCRNALAIRNSAGKRITLSSDAGVQDEVNTYLKTLLPIQNQISNMERKLLCAKLGLDEKATDDQITEKLSAVTSAATAGTTLSVENAALKTEVSNLKLEATQKKITDLVEAGIAAGKLAAGDKDKYLKLAAADYETTASLIEGMKPYVSIENKLAGDNAGNTLEIAELMKLSGNQLYLDGKLDRLKELSIENFKLKYKDAFNIEYKA